MGEQKRDVYLLQRGGLASARLMFQHCALTRYQGWLLHPDIQAAVTNQGSLRVADLATGNGIWAIEVAEQYPGTEIVGFDISDTQFPSQLTCPSNARFELGDLFAPVPPQYQQYFDVIHIRLIVAAIYTMDKNSLMKSILAMLKPGGYIQWDELIEPTSIIISPDGSQKLETAKWITRMYGVANFRPAVQWAATLPTVFEEYGLENVVGHKPEVKPSVLALLNDSLQWSAREIIGLGIKMNKPNAEEELRIANQEMEELTAAGCMCAYAWIVAVGRKPVKS